MDLSAIYSKTPKGLRARSSLIGGLSSHLMKVLTHVDGSSRAENILLKFGKFTARQLSADLIRLEQEGYIRLATVTTAPDDSWALTINFEPMVVEEYQSEADQEAAAQVLIGERPGLSSPDSLGIYLTYHPKLGLSDADRNCISNVRPEGLSYQAAAKKLIWLAKEAMRLKVTGIALKDESDVQEISQQMDQYLP